MAAVDHNASEDQETERLKQDARQQASSNTGPKYGGGWG